jgi:hypothetical protein
MPDYVAGALVEPQAHDLDVNEIEPDHWRFIGDKTAQASPFAQQAVGPKIGRPFDALHRNYYNWVGLVPSICLLQGDDARSVVPMLKQSAGPSGLFCRNSHVGLWSSSTT